MYSILKDTLKDLLKQKGLSYKSLGEHLGLTESGVKKLFQAEDCSITRLQKICDVLEVDLATLILGAEENSPIELVEIDRKVQQTLEKDPQLMDVYWLLFIEELTPKDILERYQIAKSALYRCLGRLDQLKLIIWKPGDAVKSRPKSFFLVKANGPLVEHWMRQFADGVLEDYERQQAKANSPNEPLYSQRFLYLKRETARELKDRLEGLLREFGSRSLRERALVKSKTVPIRVLGAVVEGTSIKALSR